MHCYDIARHALARGNFVHGSVLLKIGRGAEFQFHPSRSRNDPLIPPWNPRFRYIARDLNAANVYEQRAPFYIEGRKVISNSVRWQRTFAGIPPYGIGLSVQVLPPLPSCFMWPCLSLLRLCWIRDRRQRVATRKRFRKRVVQPFLATPYYGTATPFFTAGSSTCRLLCLNIEHQFPPK
jgi:hypothetical protein